MRQIGKLISRCMSLLGPKERLEDVSYSAAQQVLAGSGFFP